MPQPHPAEIVRAFPSKPHPRIPLPVGLYGELRKNSMGVNLANDEGEDLTTFNGTIPQVLMMMNGPLIKEVISTDQGMLLTKLAASGQKPSEMIDFLYLATLGRSPSASDVAYSG